MGNDDQISGHKRCIRSNGKFEGVDIHSISYKIWVRTCEFFVVLCTLFSDLSKTKTNILGQVEFSWAEHFNMRVKF